MEFKIGKYKISIWKDQQAKNGRPTAKVNRQEAIKLREQGKSYREIASILHTSKSTIYRLLKK